MLERSIEDEAYILEPFPEHLFEAFGWTQILSMLDICVNEITPTKFCDDEGYGLVTLQMTSIILESNLEREDQDEATQEIDCKRIVDEIFVVDVEKQIEDEFVDSLSDDLPILDYDLPMLDADDERSSDSKNKKKYQIRTEDIPLEKLQENEELQQHHKHFTPSGSNHATADAANQHPNEKEDLVSNSPMDKMRGTSSSLSSESKDESIPNSQNVIMHVQTNPSFEEELEIHDAKEKNKVDPLVRPSVQPTAKEEDLHRVWLKKKIVLNVDDSSPEFEPEENSGEENKPPSPRKKSRVQKALMAPFSDFKVEIDVTAELNVVWLQKVGLFDFASLHWKDWRVVEEEGHIFVEKIEKVQARKKSEDAVTKDISERAVDKEQGGEAIFQDVDSVVAESIAPVAMDPKLSFVGILDVSEHNIARQGDTA
ncbi:hypothetical protein L7F22_021763 [Adiantum nelumboides]|nr:hypothetical protein [Adiantum nelumboides]